MWSHIDGTTHTGLVGHRWIFDDFTESKITYLEVSCVNEDVGWLEVSVNSVVSGQLLVSLDYLFHDDHHFSLGKTFSFPLFEIFLEITVLAVVHDNV